MCRTPAIGGISGSLTQVLSAPQKMARTISFRCPHPAGKWFVPSAYFHYIGTPKSQTLATAITLTFAADAALRLILSHDPSAMGMFFESSYCAIDGHFRIGGVLDLELRTNRAIYRHGASLFDL